MPTASLRRPHLKVGMFGDFWSAGSAVAPRAAGPRRPALLLMVGLVLLSGCRLDLTAESVVDALGGGTVAFTAGFDAELLDQLDALGVDPTAELEAAAASSPGWDTLRRTRDDGGLEVVTTREVDDVEEIGDAFRALTAGLAEADPALLVDIVVTMDDDGATEVVGDAGLRPPDTAGVSLDGTALGPDTQELADLAAETVDAQLRIRFPGDLLGHDGDRVDGRTVIWDLPAGVETSVRARAAAPSWWAPLAVWAEAQPALTATVAGLVLVLLLAGGGVLWRRSRVTPAA